MIRCSMPLLLASGKGEGETATGLPDAVAVASSVTPGVGAGHWEMPRLMTLGERHAHLGYEVFGQGVFFSTPRED